MVLAIGTMVLAGKKGSMIEKEENEELLLSALDSMHARHLSLQRSRSCLCACNDSARSVSIIGPICMPSDIEIAEHIATAMLANILKGDNNSSYDRSTHKRPCGQ